MATIETERAADRHARGRAVVEEAAELLRGGELPAAIFNDEDVFALEREKVTSRGSSAPRAWTPGNTTSVRCGSRSGS